MSEQKHTPEPWRRPAESEDLDFRARTIYIMGGPDEENPDGYVIGLVGYTDNDAEDDANAARIVECVNEFAGVPVVEGTLAKVRTAIRDVTSDYLGVLDAHHMEQLESALAALTPKEKA